MTVFVVIHNLFRIELLLRYLICPKQVKCLRMLIFILGPPSPKKHLLHPGVIRVKGEQKCWWALHPRVVLCHELVKIRAFSVDDVVYVGSPLTLPVLWVPLLESGRSSLGGDGSNVMTVCWFLESCMFSHLLGVGLKVHSWNIETVLKCHGNRLSESYLLLKWLIPALLAPN